MACKRTGRPAPPPADQESDRAKAHYYESHDPVDLIDAGYLQEEGIFKGDRRLVDLRPERGLVRIPIAANVARKLRRAARRKGCTPADLATRLLDKDLKAGPGRRQA